MNKQLIWVLAEHLEIVLLHERLEACEKVREAVLKQLLCASSVQMRYEDTPCRAALSINAWLRSVRGSSAVGWLTAHTASLPAPSSHLGTWDEDRKELVPLRSLPSAADVSNKLPESKKGPRWLNPPNLSASVTLVLYTFGAQREAGNVRMPSLKMSRAGLADEPGSPGSGSAALTNC